METQNSPDGGGSGGGTQPFCAIAPQDMVSIVESFMSRIENLERAVSQLMAQNVQAGQLSEISQQVGWVYNVTYMGTPGWTQTPAGTLIPPEGVSLSTLGFTMSDGNTYPIVAVDSDGVLQFGLSETGQSGGSSSGGGITYALFSAPGVNDIPAGPSFTAIADWAIDTDYTHSDTSLIQSNGDNFTVLKAGSYLVMLSCAFYKPFSTSVASVDVRVGTDLLSTNVSVQSIARLESGSATGARVSMTGWLVVYFAQGETILTGVYKTSSAQCVLTPPAVTFMRLGS